MSGCTTVTHTAISRNPKPRLLVSACLLGEFCRYDGGHKRNPFLLDRFQSHAEFIPLCPEIEIGLGVPRLPIRLVGSSDNPELRGVENPSMNLTGRMQQFAEGQADLLDDIDGLVLKARSPSCGYQTVPVHLRSGDGLNGYASGVFAAVFTSRYPLLPVIQEDTLNDAHSIDGFMKKVYLHQRRRLCLPRGLDG